MALEIEHGPVRQVWFAPKANPSDKSSFLIRDDAYSKQGMTSGRTVRLGDPVDLGPYSTWKQTSWIGGEGQEVWNDPEMFHAGTVDSYSKNGKVKLHKALGTVDVTVTGRGITSITLGRNTTVVDRATPTMLMMGECNFWTGGSTPSGGYRVYVAKRGVATSTLKSDLDGSVLSFSPINDSYKGTFVGLSNGKVWTHNNNGNLWDLEHTFEDSRPVYNIESFGATYFLAGERVYRRVYAPNPDDPGNFTTTYSEFYYPPGSKQCRGTAVWNNRMWFGSMSYGRTTTVYVTDGVYTVPAFMIPGEFEIMGMTPYQGSLYIYGSRPGGDGTSFQGQMWRYNGASLTLLHSVGSGLDGEDNTIWDAVVDQDTLYWTRSGVPSNSYKAGLTAYRADTDAIHCGPTDNVGFLTYVRAVDLFDQSVACSLHTGGLCAVRPSSPDQSVKRTTDPVVQEIRSSVFDAGLSNEKKTWVRARMRVKLPANTSAELRVVLDEAGGEVSLGTVTANGDNAFRTITWPMTSSGSYLQSNSIQYVAYLYNTSTASTSTSNPELDAVEIDFAPAASGRRLQWRVRAYAEDAQRRLDGSTNPLSTMSAIEAKLLSYWEAGTPVLFWDATTSTGAPAGDGTEVIFTDFLSQSYRVDTANSDVAAEVSLGFYEVLT